METADAFLDDEEFWSEANKILEDYVKDWNRRGGIRACLPDEFKDIPGEGPAKIEEGKE